MRSYKKWKNSRKKYENVKENLFALIQITEKLKEDEEDLIL